MKKFLKKIGILLAIPVDLLILIYSIPIYLLNYIRYLLIHGTGKYSVLSKTYNILKFSVRNLFNGKDVTLESILKAYTDEDIKEYRSKTKFKCDGKKEESLEG